MKKGEKQELMVERIQQYIRDDEYKDASAIEKALKREFGWAIGRLSRFRKQEIDRDIEQARSDETQ